MAKKKTQEEFDSEIYEITGNEYTFLDEYKGSNKPITVRHNKCGNIYSISPNNFKRSKGCKKCNYDKIYSHKVKDNDYFKSEVFNLVGHDYTFIDKYVNTNTPLKVTHNKCGSQYKVAPRDFLKGTRCRKCYIKSNTMTNEEWVKRVYSLENGYYIPIDDYKGNSVKIKIRHKTCGTVYKVKPNNFITGHRCPTCSSSLGEMNITKYLRENKIKFEHQKSFNDLRGDKNPLKFDFYLPEYGVAIEYQGLQHQEPIDFFGGIKNFKKLRKHDNLKKEYCKNKDYNLVEVHFFVSSYGLVEEKLNYELKNIIV